MQCFLFLHCYFISWFFICNS